MKTKNTVGDLDLWEYYPNPIQLKKKIMEQSEDDGKSFEEHINSDGFQYWTSGTKLGTE